MRRTTAMGRATLAWVHCVLPAAGAASLASALAGDASRDDAGLAALVGGVAAAYALDRMRDPPPGTTALRMALTLTALSAAAVVTAAVMCEPRRLAGPVAVGAVVAVAYPLLKRLPLAKTPLLTATWTTAAGLVLAGRAPWTVWTLPAALPVATLVAAGCELCDVKDAVRDRAAGVDTLASVAGPTAARATGAVLAAVAIATALALGRIGLAVAAAALIGLAGWPTLLVRPLLGPLAVDAVLVLPGLLRLLR